LSSDRPKKSATHLPVTASVVFVQLKNGPSDIDLIFAPDGIENFDDAWKRHVEVEGFPVCHPDDIIASKRAANRAKDQESLPRLLTFRDFWRDHLRKSQP
jgi:hypothetical protein